MLFYIIFYALPAAASLALDSASRRTQLFAGNILVLFTFAIMAFRTTCGDYERYEYMFQMLRGASLSEYLRNTEPLYALVSWITDSAGGSFHALIFLTSLIFCFNLWSFCRREPRPILSLAISISYLGIVVGMGYIRQGIAISFAIHAMSQIMRGKVGTSYLLMILGAGFHYSAICLLPLCLTLQPHRSRVFKLTILAAAVLAGIAAVTQSASEQLNNYISYYIDIDRYQSRGAALRIGVNFVSGMLLLLSIGSAPQSSRRLIRWLAFAALLSPLLFLASSTVADRVGLYLLPCQILAFGRLDNLRWTGMGKQALQVIVVFFFLSQLLVWLYLGTFANILWIPYQSLII